MRTRIIITLGISFLFLLLFGIAARNLIGHAFLSVKQDGDIRQAAQSLPQSATAVTGATTYVYGTRLIASVKSSGTTYHYQDMLGSNSMTTNKAGVLQSRSISYPYGKILTKGSNAGGEQKYTFTGKEDDGKLMYFGARYLDPRTGRFTSVDPLSASFASYDYANDNPLRFIDPDGMAWQSALKNGREFSLVWDYYFRDPSSLSERDISTVETIIQEVHDWRAKSNFDNPNFRENLVIVPSEYMHSSSNSLPLLERYMFEAWSEFREYLTFLPAPNLGKDWYILLEGDGFARTEFRNSKVSIAKDSDHIGGGGADSKRIAVNRLTGERRDVSDDPATQQFVFDHAPMFNLFNYHYHKHAAPQENWEHHLSYDYPIRLSIKGEMQEPLPAIDDNRLQDNTDSIPHEETSDKLT